MNEITVGRVEFARHLKKAEEFCKPDSEVERRNCIPAFSEPQAEAKRVFESGAIRSSRMPRYDLIPREVLNCLADRLKLGASKYGEWNWQKGLGDTEFLKDSLNHMQGHLSNVMAGDFSEDDEYGNLGGILFGCMVRLAALKAKRAV